MHFISRISLFFCTSLLLVCTTAFKRDDTKSIPFYEMQNTRWADSVLKTLTPDERIAQLFMVAAYSNKDKKHVDEIKTLVSKYKIGGLIFFQGGPIRQAVLTNKYQALAKVPLMISIDGEWGLAMRLDSTIMFPKQMTLGAIQNDSIIYQMGVEIARQCKRLGIHVNFAPDVDVNNNSLNPVIGFRSFGEDKYNVAKKGMMYMKGMQDNGVMANAKHFPGHGDTDKDSHKTLPTVTHSKEMIDTLDLVPFKFLMEHGLSSLMVAHLFVPSLDSTANQASTLSKKVVTGLLKEKLNFKGIIFTDALNMKGVSKFYPPGVVNAKALVAGNDVLLFAEDIPTAITEIKKAIAAGEITQDEIDARCRKLLVAKQWCGLDKYKPIELKNLYRDLNTPTAKVLNKKLFTNSVTLLQNNNNLLPLKANDSLRIASLSLGHNRTSDFEPMLANYANTQHFSIDRDAKKAMCDSIEKKLSAYNLIVIHINNTNNSPAKNFGMTDNMHALLNNIISKNKTVVNVSANAYMLGRIDILKNADAIFLSYEDNSYTQAVVPQIMFGSMGCNATLPVTASPYFKRGMGVTLHEQGKIKYGIPEELGLNSYDFRAIDSIAKYGMKEKAYPGCQVAIIKNGLMIYQKSFGYHTYENKQAVINSDIYDLASVTKIAASTAVLMKMVEEKKVNLDNPICFYLPELENSNKQNIVIREMMVHQAGLRDWIPFWQRTMTKGQYKPFIYSTTQNDSFPTRVANNLFIAKNYTDSIYKMIIASELKEVGKYKYSDLGYYFIKKIAEQQFAMPLDEYLSKNIYQPMGLYSMGYKPRNRFDLNKIIPTEYDIRFRKQLVHGDVHDQGAAMLGGVGGHAGLFSNANDLAILMQMYLQKGEYAGKRYLDSAVVREFTKCQYCIDNRRGVGFDKPETNSDKDSPVCDCVSYLSYGHTGFTGTITWVDPAKDLVYVFLSNRVYPDADVNKLAKLGIRSKIQQVIYNAIK